MAKIIDLNAEAAPQTLSALQMVRRNIQLEPSAVLRGPEGKKEYPGVVSCTFNSGNRSLGKQQLLAEEFEGFVAMLRDKADNGFGEVEQEKTYKTAAQIAEETMTLVAVDEETGDILDDGEPTHIQFRTRAGDRGLKPARIGLAEFGDVVAFLETRTARITAAVATLAEAEPEAADDADDAE